MQDFIPAGTGNSRFLKSVAGFLTQYPTYEDFAAALIAGTLPIDLNGVNPLGYTQLGTPLNTASLLSAATAAAIQAAMLAGQAPNTVDEALAAIAGGVGVNGLQMIHGTYTGTGTYGAANPTEVSFPDTFKPYFLYVDTAISGPWPIVRGGPTKNNFYPTFNAHSVEWYAPDADRQFNTLGVVFKPP